MENIRKENRLIYEYIRGSHLYNLQIEGKSDIDFGGVFMSNPKSLIGLGYDYVDEKSDSKHDITWYEIKKWLHLLIKGNPNQLESLFVPKDKIIFINNDIINNVIDNRNEFLTKECFKSLFGYAKSQIQKARGLNKLIVNPVNKLLEPLDFCYTFKEHGSTKIKNYLQNNGLLQKYCGLINTPNMFQTYHLFYDWGNHLLNENITIDVLLDSKKLNTSYPHITPFTNFIIDYFNIECEEQLKSWFNKQQPIGYKGIVGEDGKSNELRLSSIPKNEKPICYMSYNETGYTKHCIDYKNYKTWEKERNPIRFESNLNQNYDAKNMSHCIRLIHMGLELAKGEGFNVVRTWDRDFILKVKNHGFEFDEIMAYIEEKSDEFNKAIETSTLKENIDVNFVNDILIDIRKQQLKGIV